MQKAKVGDICIAKHNYAAIMVVLKTKSFGNGSSMKAFVIKPNTKKSFISGNEWAYTDLREYTRMKLIF